MSEKSDKLRAMLEKEKERRIKLNNRIEILERRIQEEDSAEVNEMVRTAKVTPEQLAALLRQSATATPNPAALSAVGATFEKEVDPPGRYLPHRAGRPRKAARMEEICFSHLHRLQRQVQKRRAADEILTFTGIPPIYTRGIRKPQMPLVTYQSAIYSVPVFIQHNI